MIVITPLLVVGKPADASYYTDAQFCRDPGRAVRVIGQGDMAVIPEKDWKENVGLILRTLGADPDHIDYTIAMADR